MRRGNGGFTLVELLVVLAIVALLLGVAPFAFDKLRQSAQYRDALRTMLTDMRMARQRALTEGRDVRFLVDLVQHSYGLDGQVLKQLPKSLEMRATVASAEFRPGEAAAIRFLPTGGASGGSIDVLRPSGSGTRVRVDWLSGRVTLEALSP